MRLSPFSNLLFQQPIGEDHGLDDIQKHLPGVLKVAAVMRRTAEFHSVSTWSQSTHDGARVDVTYNESRDKFVFLFNFGNGHLSIDAEGLDVQSYHPNA